MMETWEVATSSCILDPTLLAAPTKNDNFHVQLLLLLLQRPLVRPFVHPPEAQLAHCRLAQVSNCRGNEANVRSTLCDFCEVSQPKWLFFVAS